MAQTQRIISLFLFFVFLGVTGKGRGYFQINSSLHPVPFLKGTGRSFPPIPVAEHGQKFRRGSATHVNPRVGCSAPSGSST